MRFCSDTETRDDTAGGDISCFWKDNLAFLPRDFECFTDRFKIAHGYLMDIDSLEIFSLPSELVESPIKIMIFETQKFIPDSTRVATKIVFFTIMRVS